MWYPYKNKAVRVDSTQVISLVKDQPTQMDKMASAMSGRPLPRPVDYEKIIKTFSKNAVVVMTAYFTCHTISQVIILKAIGAK